MRLVRCRYTKESPCNIKHGQNVRNGQVDTNFTQNTQEHIFDIHEVLSSPPTGETPVASAQNTS
jgi:hypothetical protein